MARPTRPFLVRFAEKFPTERPDDGCWFWRGKPNCGGGGYGVITREDGVRVLAHRASYLIHNGPIPDGLVVRHTCDVSMCVRPSHLILGTIADNNNDCFERGRARRAQGEEAPTARLTEQDVVSIRAALNRGEGLRALGRHYGVRHTTIRRIATGEGWTSVTAHA